MASVTVSFTLDDVRDASLLDRLAQFTRRDRSVAIREALYEAWRLGKGHFDTTDHKDVEAIVRRVIREEMAGHLVAVGPGIVMESPEPEEPEEAAANLDGLMGRLQGWGKGPEL